MENLGYVFERPTQNKNGKWNSVEICYDEQNEFLDATSKLVKMFKSPDGDGKCIVMDTNDSSKYILDVVHTSFDAENNIVTLFPFNCEQVK